MIKRFCYRILNFISIAAIVLAVVALISIVLTPAGTVPHIGGYSALRVLSGSMEPALETNSFILVKKAAPNEIEKGDIISFYSTDPALQGALNTHRVVDIVHEETGRVFITQGDANPIKDIYPVPEKNLVGRVVISSVLLGNMIAFLTQPLSFVLLILMPLFLMMLYNLYKVIRTAQKAYKQEEQIAIEQALEQAREKQASADKK